MVTLYWYPGNASLAPHMVLEEVGSPFELRRVDKEAGEHRSAAYLQINPNGRIPTLVDGDLVLYESAAICLHLADRHPESGLAPKVGDPARPHLYKWLMFLTNTLQAYQQAYFHPDDFSEEPGDHPRIVAKAATNIGRTLDVTEAALAAGGPYLLGNRVSVADHFLLMLCRWTRMLERPARDLPATGRFLERMLQRPAVARTFADENLSRPYV